MEPERKIEKLLRAYAKKRRAEAGDSLKLHPANRRLLQSEATCRTPEASPKREPSEGNLFSLLLAVFRRRLVLALCVVAALAVVTAALVPVLFAPNYSAQQEILHTRTYLTQIGTAARVFAEGNNGRLPVSLDEMTNELPTSKAPIDPATGKPFVYFGGGKKLDNLQSNEVLAYSPERKDSRMVLFADGRVETVTGARFAELTNQKSPELALADKTARATVLETPRAAVPAAPAASAPPLTGAERTKTALAKDESRTGDSGVNAPTAGEPAGRQPEPAESEPKKLEPIATPAPIGASAGTLSGVEQTRSVNAPIAGALPATENSDALAQNKSFDRLLTQTSSVSSVLGASQNFVQAGVSSAQNLFKNSVASAQTTPVLQSFQVQQNGDAISVVDRDGSVYHGSVQPETGTIRNEPAPAETVAAQIAPPQRQTKATPSAGNMQQAAQNYFFRVSGMNRTLKQNVVFTGNMLANSGAPQTAQSSNSFGGFGGGGGGGSAGNHLQQAAANQSQQSLMWNSRIIGTAVVASTNQIEINAVPVTQ